MNKEQLVTKLAGDAKISKAQAKVVLDSFIDTVKKTLKKGEKIALVGFGTFSVGKRNKRTGRNPQTGAEIVIPARKVVRFKAGKEFSNFVNGKK